MKNLTRPWSRLKADHNASHAGSNAYHWGKAGAKRAKRPWGPRVRRERRRQDDDDDKPQGAQPEASPEPQEAKAKARKSRGQSKPATSGKTPSDIRKKPTPQRPLSTRRRPPERPANVCCGYRGNAAGWRERFPCAELGQDSATVAQQQWIRARNHFLWQSYTLVCNQSLILS